jgi:hypothetical protein
MLTRAAMTKRLVQTSRQYAEETIEDLRSLAEDGFGRAKTITVSETALRACLLDMFYEGWGACRQTVEDVLNDI